MFHRQNQGQKPAMTSWVLPGGKSWTCEVAYETWVDKTKQPQKAVLAGCGLLTKEKLLFNGWLCLTGLEPFPAHTRKKKLMCILR